tara:strand:- start:496 stop:792 length:297 start_codon:yes stop_codon:yes gene_type:complete
MINSNNTTNEIMKTAFEKYPKAQKIVFKSDLENMNTLQILDTACLYSNLPFQTGENVIKSCASKYVEKGFGTIDDFYNQLIEALYPTMKRSSTKKDGL